MKVPLCALGAFVQQHHRFHNKSCIGPSSGGRSHIARSSSPDFLRILFKFLLPFHSGPMKILPGTLQSFPNITRPFSPAKPSGAQKKFARNFWPDGHKNRLEVFSGGTQTTPPISPAKPAGAQRKSPGSPGRGLEKSPPILGPSPADRFQNSPASPPGFCCLRPQFDRCSSLGQSVAAQLFLMVCISGVATHFACQNATVSTIRVLRFSDM